MSDISARITLAKADNRELETLIEDYLPFIKKEISRFGAMEIDYHDRLSIGMLVFMNCVRQYETSRGDFLVYAGASIRNRMRDEGKKHARHSRRFIHFGLAREEAADPRPEAEMALQDYSRQSEQRQLAEEIAELTEALAYYGINFEELQAISPKQKRSREQCMAFAMAIVPDKELMRTLRRTRRLPQAHLAELFGVSLKTIEKYRRYVIALVVILSGDYPSIRGFLPMYWETAKVEEN